MKKRLLFLLIAALMSSGCGSMLPSAKQTTVSPWKSFEDAKSAFDKITPYTTNADEMRALGFDPFTSPNIRILTYLDIMNKFLPNPSIKMEDLDEGIQACIAAKANCRAYEFLPKIVRSKRYGNVLLDLFNFRRKTKESGWRFQALVVLIDNTVVYKLSGGEPIINQERDTKNPLGPLQNAGDLLSGAVRPDL
ncbi:MAG: hypothetical protein OEW04_13780 [Nitrospirota bacterium]|nr:hypothetical protein [Nitrospirota bacterium]